MERTAFPHVDIQTLGESVNSSVTVLSLNVIISKAVETRQVFILVRNRNIIYFEIIKYMYMPFP